MKTFYFSVVFGVLMIFFFGLNVMAQTRVISGKVVDETNSALPGASIKAKGTNIATISNQDGQFTFSVPSATITLVVSFTGMKPVEVSITNKSFVTAKLNLSNNGLNDVVVIGYGSQKREDVNGSISSVTAKDIENIPQTSVDQLIQGKAAGVTVTNGTGAPGSAASVHIRGITSLSGSNEPLYVVDGVYIDGAAYTGQNQNNGENAVSPLSYLNPNDILTIDVLKDASATAIYGSRGSNGVIIITTKKGKNGGAHLNYDGYYGIQQQGKFLKMSNLRQYANIENVLADVTGVGRRGEFADPTLLGDGENWQKAVFRSAPMINNNLSMTGGNENMNYYISGGFLKQDGTIIGSNFKRYSFRTNVEGKLSDWFKLGASMTLNRTDENQGASDNGGIVYSALLNAPDQAASNADGSYTVAPASYGSGALISPVALALLTTNALTRNSVNANFYSDIKIYKDLTLRSEIGGYNNFSNSTLFNPSFTVVDPINPANVYGNPIAKLSRRTEQGLGYNWKEYFSYNHTFGTKHRVSGTLGYELNQGNYNSINAGTDTFLTNDVPTLNLGGAKIPTIGEYKSSNALQSFYIRGIYDYDNRYSLTATVRSDKSSNFAPGRQTGYFPAAAIGWTISNEAFMDGVKKIATNVKLRVGYGQVGNQNVPGYQYGAALNPTITGLGTGFNIDKYPNPLLTWQTSIQTDIGLDFTLFNRVDASFDWYNKTSKNFLFQAPLPQYLVGLGSDQSYLGGIGAPYVNGGEVSNKGIEFSINSRNIISTNFNWNTTVTFSQYVNKVVSTYNNSSITKNITSGFLSTPVTQTIVGGPIGEFYGYKVKDIFRTADQLTAAPIQFGQPISNTPGTAGSTSLGDIQYEDTNGDGVIDSKDLGPIGDPNPKFTYGLTNTFKYKDFDLSVFVYGSYGGKVLNFLNYSLEGLNGLYVNQLAEASNYWTPTNPNSNIPAPKGGVNSNLNMSTRFLESASFLRIQNVRLGYNVPSKWVNKIKLSSFKVYASAQNLFVITGYKGLDPEVGQQNQNVFLTNVDLGRYPSPRIITFGINAEF
ncbi:SusC/RagA family TonB-linked outer membrane protein [Pedobacter sp. UYEF25]